MGIKASDIPPAVLREIMARATIGPSTKIGDDSPEPASDAMLPASVTLEGGKLTIQLPLKTVSEINQRGWKGRSGRAKAAWNVVSATVGPHLALLAPFAEAYHAGGALRVRFIRCGGKRMDVMANLGSSLKAVEDALAYLLGANDGDPRWHAAADQETGGAAGVRIELELFQ